MASDLTEITKRYPREMASFIRAAKGLTAEEMGRFAREAEEADELGTLGSLFLRKGALGSYIYAKTVDPNGPYFHMLIEHKNVFDGSVVEFELQLPHSCIKAVFYAADVTRLGFV